MKFILPRLLHLMVYVGNNNKTPRDLFSEQFNTQFSADKSWLRLPPTKTHSVRNSYKTTPHSAIPTLTPLPVHSLSTLTVLHSSIPLAEDAWFRPCLGCPARIQSHLSWPKRPSSPYKFSKYPHLDSVTDKGQVVEIRR